jgi:hypothetical protein
MTPSRCNTSCSAWRVGGAHSDGEAGDVLEAVGDVVRQSGLGEVAGAEGEGRDLRCELCRHSMQGGASPVRISAVRRACTHTTHFHIHTRTATHAHPHSCTAHVGTHSVTHAHAHAHAH